MFFNKSVVIYFTFACLRIAYKEENTSLFYWRSSLGSDDSEGQEWRSSNIGDLHMSGPLRLVRVMVADIVIVDQAMENDND